MKFLLVTSTVYKTEWSREFKNRICLIFLTTSVVKHNATQSKGMALINKGTYEKDYTRMSTYAYAYVNIRIRAVRAYGTRMAQFAYL